MMNKVKQQAYKRQSILVGCLLVLAFRLSQPDTAIAQCQWTADSGKVYVTCGNVGIGTASPARILDIVASSTGEEGIRLTSTNVARLDLWTTNIAANARYQGGNTSDAAAEKGLFN